jgi:hypothetical protein
MHFRGVNAKQACRFCKMDGIKGRGRHGRYYMSRRSETEDEGIDYAALPLRQHREIMEQALAIEMARTKARKERLGAQWGIKGQVIFLLRVAAMGRN